MDTSGDSQSTSTSWHRPALASLVALAVVIIAVALAGVRAAIEQAARPPMCYGIGFGCTPDPAATALLAGVMFGLPAVVVAWVATWVGWALTRTRPTRLTRVAAWWPVWALAVGAGVLVVAVAVTVIST